MQLWLLNYIHLIKNLLCIKIVEDLAFLANQIKHSEDGEGKCILLLLSFIMSVSLQVLLKLIWWANPANKHEIHLTVWSIHWINCIVKQKPRTWKCFCLLFCRFTSHALDIFSLIWRRIIANHGFESASFLSNPWFNDATFACLYIKICMNHINHAIKFHPSKIYTENPKRLNL